MKRLPVLTLMVRMFPLIVRLRQKEKILRVGITKQKYRKMKKKPLTTLIFILLTISFLNGQSVTVLNSEAEIKSVIFVKDSFKAIYLLPDYSLNQLKKMIPIFKEIESGYPTWNIEIIVFPPNNRVTSNIEKLTKKSELKLKSMGFESTFYYLGMALQSKNDFKKYISSSCNGVGYPNLILTNGKDIKLIGPISGDMSSSVPKSKEEIEVILDGF